MIKENETNVSKVFKEYEVKDTNIKRDFEGKIADFLNKIGIDKVLHFLVFGWVCSIGFTKSFTVGVWCFIGIFILSLVKEKYIDKKIDWVDVIAGFFGGWTAFALYWILNELL